MINAVKIGDVEVVQPNPEYLAMVQKILDQNQLIVEMNAKLLIALTTPIWKAPLGKPLS